MALVIALFFALIIIASVFGWTADTHDSADWKPSHGGFRSL